jgi:hypothetical protein
MTQASRVRRSINWIEIFNETGFTFKRAADKTLNTQ